jgi:G3E family GTPase
MEDEEFKEWVGDLPDDALDYLEWLVEETEFFIDEVVLETTGLVEAQEMISKFTRS